MQYEDDQSIWEPEEIEPVQSDSPPQQEQQAEKLLRKVLDGGSRVEDRYPEILEHCHRQGMSERQLWHGLAISRQTGSVHCPELPWEQLVRCDRKKLRRRILSLIGELPAQSVDEFRGLVAFTATFLGRAEFVCDLLVYLFAERERGAGQQLPDGRRYTEFFVQKLMWELDTVQQIAHRLPLSRLDDEYADWLADRILDGEVLI